MKKLLLSLFVAVGLIGSASAATITINDLSNGKSIDYTNGYFNGTLLNPDFINIGDSLTVNWVPNSTLSAPSYASYSSESSSGVGYIGVPVNTSYSGETIHYSNAITINGSTITLSTSDGSVGGVNPPRGPTSWNVLVNTNFSTSFVALNRLPISWTTDYTVTYSSQSAYWNYVYNSGSYQYDQIRSWSTSSQTYRWTESVTIIPEPSTFALFGLGAIGLLMVMRKRTV